MLPSTIMKPLEGYFLEEIQQRIKPLKNESFEVPLPYTMAREFDYIREKHSCMGEMLRQERLRYSHKQNEFKERWTAASKKLKNVDELLKSTNIVYMTSNLEKVRATAIIEKQRQLNAEKRENVKTLLKEKVYLRETKEKSSKRLEEFKVVSDYLSKVVDTSRGEYKSINELILRANLLLQTRDDILKRNKLIENEIRKKEKEIESYGQVTENSAILLNNLITDLTEEVSEARDKCRMLESDVSHIKNTTAHRTAALAQIRLSTYNLYAQICKSFNKTPQISMSDTVKQLEHIKGSMVEMNKRRQSVNNTLNKAQAEHARLVKEEQTRGHTRATTFDVISKDQQIKNQRNIFRLKLNSDAERSLNMSLNSWMKKHTKSE